MSDEITLGGEFKKIAMRQLPLFFLIDCSSSMSGTKIGTVNTTMRELLPELAGIGEADADVKVAVLKFSSGCQWMTPTPVAPEKIVWEELEANGMTDLGEAYSELAKKMSRNEFLSSLTSTFAPIAILLSDGDPTDPPEVYKKGLAALWENKWFKHALRFALPIGREVNLDVLAEFTGNREAVLNPVTKAADLRRMLKMVSITSTSFASKSNVITDQDAPDLTKYDMLIKDLQTAQNDPDVFTEGAIKGVDIDDIDKDGDW